MTEKVKQLRLIAATKLRNNWVHVRVYSIETYMLQQHVLHIEQERHKQRIATSKPFLHEIY